MNKKLFFISTLIALSLLLSACSFTTTIQWPVVFSGNNPQAPSEPTATTIAPVSGSNSVVWIVGGRQDETQNGYEYVAVANTELISKGVPLQEYLSQVTRSDFVNSLSLPNDHQILNDGDQFVIIGQTAYIMPREASSQVPFWSISWIQYDAEKGVMICVVDAGNPGDWIGACAGSSMWVTTSMPLNQLLTSDLFAPWAKEFASAQSAFNGQVLNDKIEVLITFRR